MKRIVYVLSSVILCFCLCSCRSVNLTCADELTSRNWYAQTPAGITSNLTFSGNNASLKISSSEDEITLKGILAIDSKKFYITSDEHFRTYTFSYEVFRNRAIVTYKGNAITFYPLEPLETTP